MSFKYTNATGVVTGDSLKQSGLTPTQLFGANQDVRQYTNYKDMGGKRKGIYSGMDSSITKAETERQQKVWGDGFVRMAMLDVNGNAVADRPLNLDGKVQYPDADGTFTIVDGGMFKASAKLEHERNEAIREIVEYAGASDQSLAMTLGVTIDEMRRELGVTGNCFGKIRQQELGVGGTCWGKITQQELIDVDATPEAMGLVDKTSITYARASQKLRIAVKARKPIVSFEMTNEASKNADV